MNTDICKNAEVLLCDLKKSIDETYANYSQDTLLDTLVYAKREYGVMQYIELKEILNLLHYLKKRIDNLYDDCMDIPTDMV